MRQRNVVIADIKEYFKNDLNKILILVIVFGIINCGMTYNNYQAIKKCERKVDFRYFNNVRTQQSLFNIDINTKDGTITHRIKANQ